MNSDSAESCPPHSYSEQLASMRLYGNIILAMISILGLVWILPMPTWAKGVSDYIPLHMLLETLSIVISILVFSVGCDHHGKHLPSNFALLGYFFLATGLLDFSHMLSFAGMPDYITPSDPEKAIDFWLVARLTAAIALFIVSVRSWGETFETMQKKLILTSILAATAGVHWLVLFHQDVFPRTFIAGVGLTPFKVGAEYFLIAINLATALNLWRLMKSPQVFNVSALFSAVVSMALSELCFSLYTDVTDIFNLLGHVYKSIAYLFIYRAVFVSVVKAPYLLLRKSQDELLAKSEIINAILDNTPDAIYVKDLQGRYTLLNNSAAKFVGKAIEAALGKDDTCLFPYQEAIQVMQGDRAVIASGSTKTYEETVTTANGAETTFLSTKGPILDAWGNVTGLFGIARNISDIKAARSKLAESEARFRNMANSAPVLIWIAGLDKLCVWFNQVWLDFSGRTMEQELGNGWAEGVHPDDLDRCMEIYVSHFERREEFRMDYRLRRHDGEYRWIHDNGAPRYDANNQFLGYIGSCVDITVQKNAARAIAESEERMRLALDGAGDGVWDWDIPSETIVFSKRWYQIQGFEEGSVGPSIHSWRELVHPDDLAVAEQALRDHFAGKTPNFSLEHRVRCKNGEYKWILGRGMVVTHDADGKPLRMIGTHTDITNRKLTELDHARLLAIIMEAPDFIASSDMEARLTFLNPAGAKLIGLPGNIDCTNYRIKDCHPEWATKRVFEEAIPEVLQHGYWQGETALWNRVEQREIPVSQLLLLHRDPNGVPRQLSTIMRDIGAFKEAEKAMLRAKESAEALAKSKSEFLANMSHEIRTPMNAIIGLSHLALNKPIPNEVRDYLEKINFSSESLLGILNDILDLSKIEAGKLRIDNRPFNPGQVLDNLRNLFSHRAEEKAIDFDCPVAGEIPAGLIGDALRLQQILSNLIDNAIKFTERGGVGIRIEPVAVNDTQARLHFRVYDTGIGISREEQDKLFLPFSQVDASATRRFGGSGLGLVISRKLLKLMGSELHVESAPGHGSTFSFEMTFSVAAEEPDHQVNGRNAAPQAGALTRVLRERGKALAGARILVAEDNRINQQVVKEFLKLSGAMADIANNGLEALEMLEQNRYDAVLMDVHMPGMGGMETTEHIRLQPKYKDLPVIALTAGVTQEEREGSLTCGMNDLIVKPIDPETLINTLIKWLTPFTAPIGVPTHNHDTLAEPPIAADWPIIAGIDSETAAYLLGGDQELFDELLGMFVEDNPEILYKANNFRAQNQLTEAAHVIHKLKGQAANLGAKKLTAACAALEIDSLKGQSNKINKKWETFEMENTRLLTSINTYLMNSNRRKE